MRLWVRADATRRNPHSDFQGSTGRSWTQQELLCSWHNQNPFSPQGNSRASAAYAEKTTLPRVPADVSESVRVATSDTRARAVPRSGRGIWTSFPFGRVIFLCASRTRITFKQGFPKALGSTDSCSTAVHTKPFSTSVLQGLSGVFATTTKICTTGGSSQVRTQSLPRHRFDLPTRSVVGASGGRL